MLSLANQLVARAARPIPTVRDDPALWTISVVSTRMAAPASLESLPV